MSGSSYLAKLKLAHTEVSEKLEKLEKQIAEKKLMVKMDEPVYKEIKRTEEYLVKLKATPLDLSGVRDQRMKKALLVRKSLTEKDMNRRLIGLKKSLKLDTEELNSYRNQVKIHKALNSIKSELGEIISQDKPSKEFLSAKLNSLREYCPGDEDEQTELKGVYKYLCELDSYSGFVESLDEVELEVRSFDDFEEVKSHLSNAKDIANKRVSSILTHAKSNIQRAKSTPVRLGFRPPSIADYKFELGKAIYKRLVSKISKKRYKEVIDQLKYKEIVIDNAMKKALGKSNLIEIYEQAL